MSTQINQQSEHLGEKTLRCFHKLLQTARIHDESNQLLIRLIEKFADILGMWWREEGELIIKLSRGRFLSRLRRRAGYPRRIR